MMRLSARNRPWARVAFGLAFSIFIASAAHAQSLPVEGLQLMAESASNGDQRREVIRLGEDLHEELTNEVNELQEVRDNAQGFLLYNADGDPFAVSEAEAQDLAETLAADLFLSGDPYTVGMGLLLRAEDGSELDRAVAHGLFNALDTLWSGGKALSSEVTTEERIGIIHMELVEQLAAFDSENRQNLDEMIERIHADRAQISGIIERTQAAWGDTAPPAPDAPEGFMNEPGYYVVQVSGRGWRKGGAGWATIITGYENFIIEATDEVTEPTALRWGWQVPLHFDIMAYQRIRQEAAEERSREACEDLPGLGPRDPAPDIWEDGPNYEIVEGPITDWTQATTVRGNHRLDNNDPAGSSFWHHDGDHRWDDLDPVCESYGVDLIED